MTTIPRSAADLIINAEVGSEAQYRKKYSRPEWPGGASGITIMIGYDVGAGVSSVDQLHRELDGKVPAAMIIALEPCVGVTGQEAKAMLSSVRNKVDIPWETAIDVFMNHDVPKWVAMVQRALPNTDLLAPECLGALVSLAYNRGTGGFNSSTDRNREMRAIKNHMANKNFSKIPAEFRSMKRIWGKELSGLWKRRDDEARLFEVGLAKMSAQTTTVVMDKNIHMGSTGKMVHDLQEALSEKGYNVRVEAKDKAVFGNMTRDALLAWKADNGRDLTTEASEDDIEAINNGPDRPIPEARQKATIADLKGQSSIVDTASVMKTVTVGGGATIAGLSEVPTPSDDAVANVTVTTTQSQVTVPVPTDKLSSLDTSAILDKASDLADKGHQAKTIFGQVKELLAGTGVMDVLVWISHYKVPIIIIVCVAIWFGLHYIQKQRVKMNNTGEAV